MPIVSNDQLVSLHTRDGILLYQFTPQDYTSLTWSRELRDVSGCELKTVPSSVADRLDIIPWVHWLSVWAANGTDLLWTGPIQIPSMTRSQVTIPARDPSVFMARTRNPLTKRWEAIDPCIPATQMWHGLIEQHGLNVEPITRPDPDGDSYDYAIKADAAMMDTAVADLVKIGLRWTVVAGIPVLGPAPKEPVAVLSENDFLGDAFELTRDGTNTFNDVLVRGPDALARARIDLHGLNLQTIVNIDNMFAVSNVDRAARQYARYTAGIRDAVTMPSGSALHPDAPVALEQLIPSARFVVDAFGMRVLMELESMQVTLDENNALVTVKMESVLTQAPELLAVVSGLPKRNELVLQR